MDKERYEELKSKASKMSLSDGYRVVLTPSFEKRADMTKEEKAYIDELNQPIEFDCIIRQSIQSSSNITSYPTVKGDTVADHMQRNADTLALSGTFSLHGNKPSSFNGDGTRLANVESFFEKLKNEAVFCKIAMMSRKDNSDILFKIRENMVLTSISWDESQSSVDFSFSFKQALVVETASVSVNYVEGAYLPDQTDGYSLNFTETFLSTAEVMKIVFLTLYNAGLMTNEFVKAYLSYTSDSDLKYTLSLILSSGKDTYSSKLAEQTTITVGLGIAGAAVGAGSGAIKGLSFGPLGAAIGAIIGAIVGGVVGSAYGLGTEAAKNTNEFGLKYVFGSRGLELTNLDMNEECKRFDEYANSIIEQLDILNQSISVYSIPANVNQNCTLYLNDNYYKFSFEKRSSEDASWQCSISEYGSDAALKSTSDLASSSKTTIKELTSDNCFIKLGSTYVYFLLPIRQQYCTNNIEAETLFNSSPSAILSSALDKSDSTFKSNVEKIVKDSAKAQAIALKEIQSDLTNYCILTTELNMSEFISTLTKLIENQMRA